MPHQLLRALTPAEYSTPPFFDLTHSLARKIQVGSALRESLWFQIAQAEAPLNNQALLIVKLSKQFLQLFLEGLRDKYVVARCNAVVLDHFFQPHVAFFTD